MIVEAGGFARVRVLDFRGDSVGVPVEAGKVLTTVPVFCRVDLRKRTTAPRAGRLLTAVCEVEQVDLQTVLKEADFVLPLAAATEETENLIDAEAFALMKAEACFVNVSRGNLVDEAALEAALKEKRIAKAAMDVGRGADQRPSAHIAALPTVVATPHIGGLTVQNAETQAWSAVEQVEALLKKEMPPRAINPDSVERLSRLWKNWR